MLDSSIGTTFAFYFSTMFRSSEGGRPVEAKEMEPLSFGLHISTV